MVWLTNRAVAMVTFLHHENDHNFDTFIAYKNIQW